MSGAIWFDFFFIRPYEHFVIDRSADVQAFGFLLAVGLAVSQLAARARKLWVAFSSGWILL
ncbi:DUF4118 domain-containing protein [Actinomadura luteofluorescens]|uniref:DUF4118 domain-containing protein n=1 Tax=Actinomadura luteofluorescens TaxID=46163 RepID=UPI003D929574